MYVLGESLGKREMRLFPETLDVTKAFMIICIVTVWNSVFTTGSCPAFEKRHISKDPYTNILEYM